MGEPRESLAVLARLVIDDGRLWGQAAEGWQWADAVAVLDPQPGDPRLHWLGRPKGGSKSTDLAGVGLAWLLEDAPPLVEAFAVAADLEQANRLLDRARGFIARTPGLRGLVEVQANRIVRTSDGARIQALAADVAGSEGLLTPLVLVDELPNWADTASGRAMWASVVSAVPKWPGCRLVVIGHAGGPEHWSYPILERARLSPAWRVNEIGGPLPWVSPEALEEQRHLLTPSQYARRHLNVWTTGEDRLATRDDVEACATLPGPLPHQPGHRYVLALDLGVKRDRTVLVAAHLHPVEPVWLDGMAVERAERVTVDRKWLWKPALLRPVDLDDVEQTVLAAWDAYGRPPLVCDPWQAIGLAQRLRAKGLDVIEFTFSSASVGRLASVLYGLLRDHRLALDSTDAELLDELSNVQLRETAPGVFRMDHSAGGHDDQAVTIALAAEHLLSAEPERPGWVGRYSASTVLSRCPRSSRETELLTTMAGHGDPTAKALLARGTLSRRAR